MIRGSRLHVPLLCTLLGAVGVAGLAASARATVHVVLHFEDAITQQPTACRLQIRGPGGWLFAEPDTALKTHQGYDGVPFVHVEGSLGLDVEPGSYEIRAVRGIHGIPVVVQEEIQTDLDRTVALGQWIDPHMWGWLGADPHVHHTHQDPPATYPPITPEELGRMCRAEGLDALFVLANDPLHPGGPVLPPQPGVCLTWGEEYRSHYWGHVVLLGLSALVLNGNTAGCCAFDQTAWPTLAARLGPEGVPLALMAHPHSTDDPAYTDYWPGTGYARELPALALGNVLQGMAVAGVTNGPSNWALQDYLDGLRAGAHWAAIGETDRYLAGYGMGPPGLQRTYAKIDSGIPGDPQAYGDAWQEAVRHGRTFATSGPFLRLFLVDGRSIGSTVTRSGPGTVLVTFGLTSQEPIERVILHGATGVHWEHTWPAGRATLDTSVTVGVTTDDFFVLEAQGLDGAWHLDLEGPRLVSSPIWVDLGIPWPVPADVSRRGADGLTFYWERSILKRGYPGPAESLATRQYLLGAAAAYEAMFDDPPGPLWPVWPPDDWFSATTSVTFRWTRSRSFDQEPTTYRVTLADTPDLENPVWTTVVADTFATWDGLVPGSTYTWAVEAIEPGEPPRPQETSPQHFQVSSAPVAADPADRFPPALALSAPRPAGGGIELTLELARAAVVRLGWYDVRGRRLAGSGPTWQDAGTHAITWDGRDARGLRVASGVYWLVAQTADARAVQRVVLFEP